MQPFQPQYYQYVRAGAEIAIETQFSYKRCDAVQKPLTGFTLSGDGTYSVNGRQTTIQETLTNVKARIETVMAKEYNETSPRIHVHVEQGNPYTGIYYASTDEQTSRVHCLLVAAAGTQQIVAEGHVKTAPQQPAGSPNVYVYVRTMDGTEVAQIEAALVKAVVEYGGFNG